MVSREKLENAYAEMLGRWKWDWIATLTHAGYPSRAKLMRKFDAWVSELQREDGTRTFRYVAVVESGAYGDNHHLHVLVGGLKRQAQMFPWPWRDRWQEVAGQAAIVKFDPKEGGIRYLLKTLLPDSEFDITFKFQQPKGTSKR